MGFVRILLWIGVYALLCALACARVAAQCVRLAGVVSDDLLEALCVECEQWLDRL